MPNKFSFSFFLYFKILHSLNFIRNASRACYEIRFVTTSLRKKGCATIRLYKPTKYDSRLRRYEKWLRHDSQAKLATKYDSRLRRYEIVFRPSFFVFRISFFVFRSSFFVLRYSFFVLLIEPMKRASCFSMLLTEANRL